MAFLRNTAAALAASVAFGLAIAPACSAATMNFDELPGEGEQSDSYKENGIRATALGGALATYNSEGFAHLDDSGTGFAYGIDFTMSGLFDAVGFSLVSAGNELLGERRRKSETFFVSGYLGEVLVSRVGYVLSNIVGTVQSFVLGEAFANISRLRIELVSPRANEIDCAPCAHFDLDEVTLEGGDIAPVPLPATGALLGAAGLGLWGIRRRRRISAAA